MLTFHRRILVVDDEANVAFLLQRGLRHLDASLKVQVAHSAAQALKFLQDEPFDLIITDYHMPEMNGLELARVIRQSQPQVKVILISAHPSAQLADQVDHLDLESFLVKPFSTRYLRQIVCELLTLPELPSRSQGGNGHGHRPG